MAIVLNGTTGITAPALDALDLELNNVNVVERGSNANGDFIRFADGTQICTHEFTSASIATNTISGTTWTFPATFFAPSYGISFAAAPNSSQDAFGVASYSNNLTASVIANIRNGATTAQSFTIKAIVIGRWF